jgi:hypothetical protein
VQIDVKVLQAVTIVCQKSGCEQPATHLFRSSAVEAYCEPHAREEAGRSGIDLPEIPAKPSQSAGLSSRSAVKTSSAA